MIQGASEIVARVYALPGRATRAIVDLDAIAENVACLRRNQRSNHGLMAVVKAAGYGHGAVMTARTALDAGADRLGVATVGEAVALRAADLTAPVLILGPIDPSEVDRSLEIDTELTVGSLPLLTVIQDRAEALGKVASVHLKVDTGMHRFGSAPGDIAALVETAVRASSVRLAGFCTHLATADDPESAADVRQLELFSAVIVSVRSMLPLGIAIHASNSAASIRGLFEGGTFDRVGIALYGLSPGSRVGLLPGMRPSLSLSTRLTRVHEVSAGEAVSYGRTYVAEKEERLGLLPVGYGDGYLRELSNRAWARVGGSVCPVRGRVCMDQTIIGNLPAWSRLGELVGLLGSLLDGPTADELAEAADTINYPIVTNLSPRIPRYYHKAGMVVATLIEGKLDVL